MSTLNIRDVPEKLLQRVRVRVAKGAAESSRAYVLAAIEEKLKRETESGAVKEASDAAPSWGEETTESGVKP